MIFHYIYFLDDSDEPAGLVDHLPRRLLAVEPEERVRRRSGIGGKGALLGRGVRLEADIISSDNDEEDRSTASQQVSMTNDHQWKRKNPDMVGTCTPSFVKPVLSTEHQEKLQNCKTAFDYYKIFNDDTFAEDTVYQSKLYANQKGFANKDEISVDVLRCTEAVLLHSGYNSVPRRKMLWESKPDCRNELITNAVRRREVDAMLRSLHFRDNTQIDSDNYYKVRPIFDNLNKSISWFKDNEKFSVDEVMIPYYGRHSSKQYIRGKPVRYGFKVWSLCTSDGAGCWFEPYCGRSTRVEDHGLGQGPNVVIECVNKTQLSPGSELYFDNLFTSFPLLDALSLKQIAGTGTVRKNKLNKVPIISKDDLEKKSVERGFSDVAYRNDQVLVAWRDNKGVYMTSNKFGSEANTTCRRFCRAKHKYIQVPIPDMFKAYNNNMGGVDLLDSMVAVYRVPYRIRKWWFAIYSWSLSIYAVNGWRLRMKTTGQKEPFLDFLRELCIEMFLQHGKPYLKKPLTSTHEASSRFDGLNHWIVNTDLDAQGKPKRRNCKNCSLKKKPDMKAAYICEKCNVPLHVNCFKEKFQKKKICHNKVGN